MALELYFLRHGQTDHSRENLFCGSGSNPELTREGAAMAKSFAAEYAKKIFSAIYCSPLTRARQTAAPIEEVQAIKSIITPALQEINYGSWEGKTVPEVQDQYHDDHVRWLADPGWNAPTVGESGIGVSKRVLGLIDDIQHQYKDGRILLVSHKATIRVALCALLGIDVGRFRFRFGCPVASLSVVEFTGSGPLLKSLADRSHLNKELRELPGT